MPIVEVNGQELEFPDDMQPDAIKQVLQAKFPKSEQGLLGKLGETQFAQDVTQDTKKMAASGVKNLASFGSTEPAWEAESAGGKILANAARPFRPIYGAAELYGAPAVSALNNLVAKPVTAVTGSETAGALATIPAALIAPSAGKAIANKLGVIAKDATSALPTIGTATGNVLAPVNKARAAFEAKKSKAILETVLPKETPSQIADTITQRTLGGGLLSKVTYTPKESEKFMAMTAKEIGIKPNAPIVRNVQVANFAKNKEAERLKSVLDKANVSIEPNVLNQGFSSIAEKIAANPLVEENSAAVRKILEAAQSAVDSNPKTAAGLLQARKDFDRAITEFQPTALDTTAPATAFRFASKQVRQGMNDLVANAVPTEPVKQSLAKQSSLYDIIENLASKAGEQGKIGGNRLTRFMETPTGKVAKYGAVAGAGAALGTKVIGAATAGTQ